MPAHKNLVGQQFGKLTVLSRGERVKGRIRWICNCTCGNFCVVSRGSLKNSVRPSCGCVGKGSQPRHGLRKTIEYKIWQSMLQRCNNPKARAFKNYGGRGIKVCPAWENSVEAFFSDMGPRPSSKHSLDRIDNDAGYYPENCRWATKREQSNNRRCSAFLTYEGRTMTKTEWSREVGISPQLINLRLKYNWTVAEALTIPVGKKPDRIASHLIAAAT